VKRLSSRGAVSITVAVGIALASGMAAAALVAGSAQAAAKPSDTCTKLSVTVSTGVGTISGCTSDVSTTDPAEPGTTETKGSGTITSNPSTGAGTIKWKAPFEGGATVNETSSNCVVGTSGCPTDETETKACPATAPTEVIITTTISAGSDDATAVVKGEVCTNGSTATLEPGTKLVTPEPAAPNS
jgi:hypothetical protein